MFEIGVNGFGTIGRRIATAAKKQKDITIKGVSSTSPSWKIHHIIKDLPFYLSLKDYNGNQDDGFEKSRSTFLKFGIRPKGTILDLMDEVSLIVDATPKKVGKMNKENVYSKKKDLHVIFQGGEKKDIANITFNAQVNYKKAVGEQYIRVPSCNTTAMLRYLQTLQEISKIDNVIINLIRRGADPDDYDKGPINDYVPTEIPSHHVEDVLSVYSDLDGKLTTFGVKVPVTLTHMHNVILRGEFPSRNKILDAIYDNPRLVLVGGHNGVPTAAEIMEANKRENIFQIVILEKTLHLYNSTLVFSAFCHQEADVVPENIDAIRASLGFEDSVESISLTNKYLDLHNTKKTLESYFPVT